MGFYYDFEILDEKDYRLVLRYEAEARLIKQILFKTKSKLKRTKKINADGVEIKTFTIPDNLKPTMLPALNRAVKKNVKYVADEVIKDGYRMLNSEVIDAYYEAIGNDWIIRVFVKGNYEYGGS